MWLLQRQTLDMTGKLATQILVPLQCRAILSPKGRATANMNYVNIDTVSTKVWAKSRPDGTLGPSGSPNFPKNSLLCVIAHYAHKPISTVRICKDIHHVHANSGTHLCSYTSPIAPLTLLSKHKFKNRVCRM